MLMCSTHIILSLLHLHSFTGNREGPSQAFENPQRAVCQSGVRGPTVSLGNRLQNTISGSRLRRRWGGGPICIFNLHKGLTVQFQSFSILNNIFFFFLEPNQAKRAVQRSPRFSRLVSDVTAEWIYLQPWLLAYGCTHMYPLSDSGSSAPPLLAPRPCMHWPVEQSPGRTAAVFLFCVFFLLPWGTRKAGWTHQDFWGRHNLWLLPEHEGVQNGVRWKYEGTKRQKTSWLVKRKEKLEELKVEKLTKSDILWRKMSCMSCFKELVEGTEKKSVEMLI